MRHFLLALVMLLLPMSLVAQQSSADPTRRTSDAARRAAEQARRDSLELEVAQKFVEQLTRELRLDATQRAQTEAVLKESGARRRQLMSESGQLRARMFRALRDRSATDADFAQLLTEYDQLRVREHDLWRRDQEELARYLNPRQRTQFLIEWSRFQDRVRAIMEQRSRDERGGGRSPH